MKKEDEEKVRAGTETNRQPERTGMHLSDNLIPFLRWASSGGFEDHGHAAERDLVSILDQVSTPVGIRFPLM
jgi:hypothetical protein